MTGHTRRRIGGVVITIAGLSGAIAVGAIQAQIKDTDLLESIRRDDTRTVQALLKGGADAETRDDRGATALMHAAAVASVETVRTLLDARADVHASSQAGATALMWATGDTAKVRLLLDRGAAVNARMKDGTTALVTAARRANLDAVRLLLARGADPRTDAVERTELLRLMFGERTEIGQVLAAAGIEPTSLMPREGAPVNTLPTLSDPTLVRELLDRGVSPNPRGRFPVLANAVFEGHLETVRLLLERGADPNARGQHQVTPLMMAAAATRPDLAIVRLLIERGATVDARDEAGRTALDWALLQGDTPVVELLRKAGSPPSTTLPLSPLQPAQRPPSTARLAVVSALQRLTPGGPVLYERTKCISCHHQMLPLMAMARGQARGVAIDSEAMTQTVRAITEVWNNRRENLMLARSRDGGGANELTYGLLAFAEAGVPSNSVTDAAVVNLLSTQRGDGSWVFLDTRPPQADNSRTHFTAMAIRGLDTYSPPGLRTQVNRSVGRALGFLRAAVPDSTQDEAFRLLGFVWSRVPPTETATQAKRLLALQRPDGGWGQLPTMASDAYATGEALYALRASGLAPSERAYTRGVEYLLRTQLEDGTWFVRSRAFGFQPYFETGFPHGVDQFISASATAWAAIGLTGSL
jgi:ankyrin repeat protein